MTDKVLFFNMVKRFALFVTLCVAIVRLSAQTITGVVTDADSGEPLPYLNVYYEGKNVEYRYRYGRKIFDSSSSGMESSDILDGGLFVAEAEGDFFNEETEREDESRPCAR